MSEIINLVPLTIQQPDIDSIDPNLRAKLERYRLDPDAYGDDYNETVRRPYSRLCNIEMPRFSSEESNIWTTVSGEKQLSDEDFIKSMPQSVADHFLEARKTGVFTKFYGLTNSNLRFSMILGCALVPTYILASWQPEDNDPIIDLDVVMDWIIGCVDNRKTKIKVNLCSIEKRESCVPFVLSYRRKNRIIT